MERNKNLLPNIKNKQRVSEFTKVSTLSEVSRSLQNDSGSQSTIDFHIPHRKLLEKMEFKTELPEPLAGFGKDQSSKIISKHPLQMQTKLQPIKTKVSTFDNICIRKSPVPRRVTVRVDNYPYRELKKQPDDVDLLGVIDKFKKKKLFDFIYMNYAVPKESIYFTPYCLRVVPFHQINKKDYFTISGDGVSHFSSEMSFTKLCMYEENYNLHCKLREIDFVKMYRIWKSYYLWRRTIVFKKFTTSRNRLQKTLLTSNPTLGKCLLSFHKKFNTIYQDNLANLSTKMDIPLFHFIDNQTKALEHVKMRLRGYRDEILPLIYQGCYDAFTLENFTLDNKDNVTTIDGMSYTEKAKKRKFCERLTSFIKLIDYITINTMHHLIKVSYHDLASFLQSHYDRITFDKQFNEEMKELNMLPENKQWPLIQIQVGITDDLRLSLNPPENVTIDIFTNILASWNNIAENFKTFLSDTQLSDFTCPIISGKRVDFPINDTEKSLQTIMNQDNKILNDMNSITRIIKHSYESLNEFLKSYNIILEMNRQDSLLDISSICNSGDTNTLREIYEKLNKELETNDEIPLYQTLGLFFICLESMKTKVLMMPQKILNIFSTEIRLIARRIVAEVIAESESVTLDLNRVPVTSSELVDYNSMLNNVENIVVKLEDKLVYIRDVYVMMDEFKIDIFHDDMQDYLGLNIILNTLRSNCDEKLQSRDVIAKTFSKQIQQDTLELKNEIQAIQEEINNDFFLNIHSASETVHEKLNNLMEELKICQKKYGQILEWQKLFKIPPTQLEILDEIIRDVRLRQLLWTSFEDWNIFQKTWYESEFSLLDAEEMQTTTINFGKTISQLEKGLPCNDIIVKLKEKVDLLKTKLATISYLKNPSLKQRHWISIEGILKTKFTSQTIVTLITLEDIQLFDHTNELMEVSGQASSEASLDALLTKIEDTWKSLELPIIPYRDTKDVYMLGGLEEIQIAIDESMMLVGIILSSRNCTHIKSKVKEWERLLDVLSTTLAEWFQCMQTWMYLEIIFSAPDIKRQLPNEARLFVVVDKTWKDIMRKTAKVPLAITAATKTGLYDIFKDCNRMLDKIMKCLETYLEIKRISFPRFYFLSNDELLDILAQTRNPHAVQPHLRKCFDAISKLEFAEKTPSEATLKKEDWDVSVDDKHLSTENLTTDIIAMLSPESECVQLGKGLKARGNVEDWLGKVEEAMFAAVKKCMKLSLNDYLTKPRTAWIMNHPNQIVLTVSQIMWAKNVHKILESRSTHISSKLAEFEKKCIADLNELAELTRRDLSKLLRRILCALITIDVHARDTISNMKLKKVNSPDAFEWLKMIRYYWDEGIDNCIARMSSASQVYGYEYIGAGGVLVITPLTDRCYLCLMGALQLDLGGAPSGPAGTGKTETTKDLAKSLAVQCVVFNCSEGLDYKMMGRFFSGLVQSGAWCCFDEFNRINIEVLSVIAQQLIVIRNAKLAKHPRFIFEGREIKLVPTCATFITMNPGYAGRTELPDNLKSVFRPISMMVPDYGLIAEVILYSEGFESSRKLSKKMVQMYKLCSEQLSQQDHYDFGMRAVKSVLVMAGSLKRASPDQYEEVTLMCALRDSNLPKFLADDALLFIGILSDLFPGLELPQKDYKRMENVIETVFIKRNLQIEKCQIQKVIQLHETMIVRWGVMLVGPTGGGKTTVLHVLGDTLTDLYNQGDKDPYFQVVHKYTMNPKSLTMGELYGEVNNITLEWKDGLLAISLRRAVQCQKSDHQWIICDGPVDAIWIENMNTVLDDNKMLCLANSERIKLSGYVHMIFEVADLAQASPATVSRCGMVYIDPSEIRWYPIVRTWIANLPLNNTITRESKRYIYSLFEYINEGFVFITKYCSTGINQVDLGKAEMLCHILQMLLSETEDKVTNRESLNTYIFQCFMFSYVWAIGGNLQDDFRKKFEVFIKTQFEEVIDVSVFPDNLWNVFVNTKSRCFETWENIVPIYTYNKIEPFFETLVPTIDTIRYGYIMECLFKLHKPVMITGNTGVGKSVISKAVLKTLGETDEFLHFTLNFSAQTTSARTQEIVESHLEKRKRTLLRPPFGKQMLLFIDDVNMPKLDIYGSQPTIELLRQFLDFGGLYDRGQLYWKDIQDVVLATACAPPGGGRNMLTPRFTRHFSMLYITTPSDDTLKVIFKSILDGFLNDFSEDVSCLGKSIVNASVDLYSKIISNFLPTPDKSHYIFNLRDLSKCMQGILQANPITFREPTSILRLFYHESLRVFQDRLINDADKCLFCHLMHNVCMKQFGEGIIEIPSDPVFDKIPVLLFGDFLNYGVDKENRIYEEITDIGQLKEILYFYLDEYNSTARAEMNLVLFNDAAEHVIRVARILRAERGHVLLVGPGGSGRRSLATLAAYVNGYRCFGMLLTRNYDLCAFHDDLRNLYFNTGIRNEETVFLFTDTQILQEEFLDDINNMLNSGEVPNLFEGDDYEKIIVACRDQAKAAGVNVNDKDAIFSFFINKIRSKLHLCICMSPVGENFRRRCRMFPSIVNCCTIDWFVKWPQDALWDVAKKILAASESAELVEMLSEICVIMHEDVEVMTERLYTEFHRYFYTTPSSYLDLLKLYQKMLDEKRQEILRNRSRISNGLQKLYETYEVVQIMEKSVKELEPVLVEKSNATEEMVAKLTIEQAQSDAVRKEVLEDETKAKMQAEITQELANDAARDLEQAMPAMDAAQKALKSLNKADINELRVFQKPPALVKFVMEPVCVLLGAKTDWDSAKKVLGDSNFLKNLEEYDKDHIQDSILKKIKIYIDNKDFQPKVVEKVSKVCRSMCLWVRAIDTYAKVFRIVEPKIIKQKEAEVQMTVVMKILREKQQMLMSVESQLSEMMASLAKMESEMKRIQASVDLAGARLVRASRLTQALADEQVLWEDTVKNLTNDLNCASGDIIIAAGCVAYFGAFPSNFRQTLIKNWLSKCASYNIPTSPNFSLVTVLSDSFTIRQWNTFGLPLDPISIESGILVVKAGRWPLMIDPQEQANRWIRNMERLNGLQIIKLVDTNYMRTIENCIRLGQPVLIEEIGETLDPILSPILDKHTFHQGGRLLIHLGDSDIEYDPKFKLYLTTKHSNPHYMPNICIQVTIVNFTVTLIGLEDQLLADVVRLKRPDLEQQRSELIMRINDDKIQLKAIEDKILKMLFSSTENVLDDEELIDTLNESKETSEIVIARLQDSEVTEENISIAREIYRPIATRGAVLFFVVTSLADIDPMYQYSLKYYQNVFSNVIRTSKNEKDFEAELTLLLHEITLAVYKNISRGLFERHKLVFSFMLNVAIFRHENKISDSSWLFLLKGPVGTKVVPSKKPNIPSITDAIWLAGHHLDETFEKFTRLKQDLLTPIHISIGDFSHVIELVSSTKEKSNIDWDNHLDYFEKLCLLKALKNELLVDAITEYINLYLGSAFIENSATSLQHLYSDTSNVTPLVFILNPGSDPFRAFQKFAIQIGYEKRLQTISLGQGQGPIAEKMIFHSALRGDWVFLQNCHLAASWMLSLEQIVQKISTDAICPHQDFRLFLSSMPTKDFPVSILRNSVKVTNEPPKGLKSNIKRSFQDIDYLLFENHDLGQDWRTIIFGICLFHGVIQERKKFGPLGWTIIYEFNDSDRDCAILNFQMFCKNNTILWDALEYIIGEITYGGRVTDEWDQRCLKTILKKFFSPKVLLPDYKYSPSGIYYCPKFDKMEDYLSFMNSLPLIEEPEIFGMHTNANIVFQNEETNQFINNILKCQSLESSKMGTTSPEQIVLDLTRNIQTKVAVQINIDLILPKHVEKDSMDRVHSLTIVLIQEINRFNKLLKFIHASISELEMAIKGLVVMSEDLEDIFKAFMNNHVPKLWSAKSYNSIKTLGSWVHDLTLRVNFVSRWMQYGAPPSSWISGLFFPQGLLTGTLQAFARKHEVSINELSFDFIALPTCLNQEEINNDPQMKFDSKLFKKIQIPKIGINVHGIFIDAGKWDYNQMLLIDADIGEQNPPLPVFWLKPVKCLPKVDKRYIAPLYKTAVRAGVLSTTGHSTNFVVPFLLPSLQSQDYWVMRGTALLLQITD